MKILIADDERLVRLSLKNMLEELYPNKYVFIDAKNGQELINLSKQHQPNICFVDINMPLLDGLSALKICKDICQNTEWFILTGEAEFSFAKEAVKIGVRNYLLKPVSIDDLKENIDNAERYIFNSKVMNNKKFELDILSILNPTSIYDNKIINNSITLSQGNYSSIVFYIDSSLSLDEKNKFIIYLQENLEENLKYLLSENINFAFFKLLSGELCLIMKSPSQRKIIIDDIVNNFQQNNISITPICTKTVSTLTLLYEEIKVLKEFSSLRAIYKCGSPLYMENLQKSSKLNAIFPLSKDIMLLYGYYLEKNQLKFIELINNISSNNRYTSIINDIDMSSLNKFMSLNLKINSTFNSFYEMLKYLLLKCDSYFYSTTNQNKDNIDEIMDYVKENYMKDIGVNTIAELYGITPNYLSKIFHEKSGMKFSDYITHIRVNAGKRILLENKSFTIKDVSSMVGYFSPRHFTKQFYKIYGYYPSDLNK